MSSAIHEYLVHLRRRDLSAATIGRRRQHLRAFSRWLDDDLFSATPADIEAFLDERNASGKNRYCWLSNLSVFYDWCVRHELAVANPVAKIERPKVSGGLPRPPTDRDVAWAFEQAQSNRIMFAWLSLWTFAGLRCGGVADLDVDSVILSEDLLRVVEKGRKERLVPLHPIPREALERHGLPRHGPVFVRPRGGRYPAHQVSREGSAFLHDIGLNVTPHQFRHWFASKTLRECKNLKTVQHLMGHADASTTARYTQLQMDDATDAVSRLALPGS